MNDRPDTVKIPTEDLFSLAKEAVERFGSFAFIARGYSMLPHITDKEKVTLGATSFDALIVGDMVLAKTADGPRLHKVVETGLDDSGHFIVIRGSNPDGESHTVRSRAIAGRVIEVKRSPLRNLGLLLRGIFKKD